MYLKCDIGSSHGFTNEGSSLLGYDTVQNYQHLRQFPASKFKVVQEELNAIRTVAISWFEMLLSMY